jgi:hypothetical protein
MGKAMRNYLLSGYADFRISNPKGECYHYNIQVKDGVNYEESYRLYVVLDGSNKYVGKLNPRNGTIDRGTRSAVPADSMEYRVICWFCNVAWRNARLPHGYLAISADGSALR